MSTEASATMTLRLDRGTRRRLDRLAEATDRTRSFLAGEAIRTYLDREEWQVAAINEGIRSADSGRLLPHADVAEWLRTWGTKGEGRAPSLRKDEAIRRGVPPRLVGRRGRRSH